MNEVVEIYTDGACKGNPGIGGWGAWIHYKGNEKSIFGGEENTTNNRMEIMAAIKALEALKRPSQVKLYTDSSYVQKGMTEWLHGWKAKNWRTAGKKAVKNDDLWRKLDILASQHQIEWLWVRGHDGNIGNERADALANAGVEQVLNLNKAI
jgi:ribonuclease HI